MDRTCENHRRTRLAAASLCAAGLAAGLLAMAGEADASRSDRIYLNAWACSTLYSRTPINVLDGGNRETAICLGEGKKGRTPMSRGEAWELCREQFDAMVQVIAWTSRGWHCRYHPR